MNQKSFTLIEILVVIVVIGILSSFILVGMSSITNSANIAKSKVFIDSMDKSLLLARVSQWKLDEAVESTTAIDSWGANTGNLSGTAPLAQFQTTGCPSNNCLLFDGNDYIDITSQSITLAGLNSYTISAWFYANNLNDSRIFYENQDDLLHNYRSTILISSNLLYFATFTTAGISSSTPIITNSWYNVVGVYNGSKNTIYLNSVSKNENNQTGSVESSSGSYGGFTLGNRKCGATIDQFFSGKIDDVRIYNQAIPISQIEQNYFVGLNNLFKNNGITLNEFNQRIVELKTNLANNE